MNISDSLPGEPQRCEQLQHVDQGTKPNRTTAYLDILSVNQGASTLKTFLSKGIDIVQ